MKLSKISFAVAAISCVAATPAMAILATSYVPANAINIYVSGATAQNNALKSAVFSLCTAGSIHEYTASNQAVYLCTPTVAYGPGSKTQLAVYKHSPGGSGNGVAPVNNQAALPFLDLAKITTANCPQSSNTSLTTVSCTANDTGPLTSTAISPIGISDVEPAFFAAKAGNWDNLKSESLAAVIFAPNVTDNVYQALQAAQGLTVGDTTAANIPSLSTAQLTTIFTRAGSQWNEVAGTSIADNNVYLVRREDLSGTQKTFEALIGKTKNSNSLAKTCYAGAPSFLPGDIDIADNTAADLVCDGGNGPVIASSASGSVTRCLNKLQTSGIAGIGIATTEIVASATVKPIRVNGVIPNYANAKSGAYPFWSEATLNTRVSPALSAEEANFVSKIKGPFASTPTNHPQFGNTTNDTGRAGLIELDKVTGLTNGIPFARRTGSNEVDNCLPARR